jgi:quinoprotein glucose dehydrogenase
MRPQVRSPRALGTRAALSAIRDNARMMPRPPAGATVACGRAYLRRAYLRRALLALACHLGAAVAYAQAPAASDWGFYGGDAFGQRFSHLEQINRSNVAQLAPAWTYRTGELGAGLARAGKLTFEATPVLAFGLLYLETATNVVIALDPQSGRERWRFDPHIDRTGRYAEAAARGVSVWQGGAGSAAGPCARRVFTGTLDARLLALDAGTGRPCADFGSGGQLDLTRGIRIRDAGAYLVTSPPAVYRNVIVVGSAIGDNRAADLERGVIRAFDAVSGAQLWAFDPLPDSPSHPAAGEWDLAQAAGA